MAGKKKTERNALDSQEDPKALRITRFDTETAADAMAHTALEPSVQAALTVRDYNKDFGEMAINTLVSDLGAQCRSVNDGDLTRAEALLTAQVHTLDAIFHKLARKAIHCEYLNQFDVNLRLALKAQSQCRATAETLAAIKNPQPVAFVRQANIAHGPQQVNNGATSAESVPRAREMEKAQNKVLEHQDGGRLDIRAKGTAISVDSTLEAVGALHRAQDEGR